MSRSGKKMWVIGIWAGLGILLGMQFANSNESTTSQPSMEINSNSAQEVTLPLPQINPNPGVAGSYTITFQPIPADTARSGTSEIEQVEVPDYAGSSPQEILIPGKSESSVDVLADKTANLLQKASQKSIRFVVSLFSSVTE